MFKPIVMSLALLTGCAGWTVDEDAAVARGRANSGDTAFKIQPMTPELIVKLAKERTADVPDADPKGNAAPPTYTIAPLDVLQVTVWDHPELTLPAGQFQSSDTNGNRVEADGSIFYPHVGVVQVAGMTVAAVRTLLTQRLSKVIVDPQVDVRIAAFRSKRVQITGEVGQPSTMPLTDVPVRVQDAIAFAKGFTPEALNPGGLAGPGADPSNVTLTRGGKTFHLDLLALYERGDNTQNWLLEDGDSINVADRSRNVVFVMGEVKQQTAKLMIKRRMTLAQALADASGVDLATAKVGKIYVIRGDYRAPSIFRLDASSADALLLAKEFPLQPRDIVLVSTSDLTRWNRVMAQILPTVQVLYDVALGAGIVRTLSK
jgi:polysaccharide export outer membrane protein